LQGLKQVGVGIRPHALRLVPPAPGRITGRVFLREPLGLEDEVLVEMANGTQVKVVAAAGEEFPERASVGLDFAPADLYLFHPESSDALCHGIA
jgi:ABC-type Fe3+/spermidine/putrescine transport system ATPase subunit